MYVSGRLTSTFLQICSFVLKNKQLHVVSRTELRLSEDLRGDSGINGSVLRVRMRFI